MTKLYGNLPIDLGLAGEDVNCDEMMLYLYLPIKLPGHVYETLEPRLEKFYPITNAVYSDCSSRGRLDNWINKYVYLTVKTLLVSPGCLGQRPGWHSDGFMTNDINYIWYTDVPTIFYADSQKLVLPQDHEQALELMQQCQQRRESWKIYPTRHLLRLDETVIHKASTGHPFTGMRTFVKISVSDHIYAHKGNSINPDLPLGVEYISRGAERNCPITHRR